MVEATDGISLVRQLGSRRVDLGTLHIPTMLPLTLLPKDKYPVIATRTYTDAADPMLAAITLVVLRVVCQHVGVEYESKVLAFCVSYP
jgi:hypothetical protein